MNKLIKDGKVYHPMMFRIDNFEKLVYITYEENHHPGDIVPFEMMDVDTGEMIHQGSFTMPEKGGDVGSS